MLPIAHLDPREWVEAWNLYATRNPAAAKANEWIAYVGLAALAVLVLGMVVQRIVVPLIMARRGVLPPKEEGDG